MQNFVLIQPRTSPPKICKIIFEKFSKKLLSTQAQTADLTAELAIAQAELEVGGARDGVAVLRLGRRRGLRRPPRLVFSAVHSSAKQS